MKVRTQRHATARRLVITSAALVGTALTPLPAFAQDSTWNGATGDYTDPANWNPAAVPTNRATFSSTGQTNVTNSGWTMVNQILFDANAQTYNITNTNAGALTIDGIAGVGIDNQSAVTQTFNNQGTLVFNAASVAGGPVILNNNSGGTGAATITLNGGSVLGAAVTLNSIGGNASAVGTVTIGGTAEATFNGTSAADDASLTNLGGSATAVAQPATGATAVGGSAVMTFNDDTHADNATILNTSGFAIAIGDVQANATAVGGVAILSFNDNSHADGATITNSDQSQTAIGSADGGTAVAVGGVSSLTFSDASHADGATIANSGSSIVAIGGLGLVGVPVTGGDATAIGAINVVSVSGTAHLDNATITNRTAFVTVIGGSGGNGDVGVGGTGGSGTGLSGISTVSFAGASHANGATIDNGAAAAVLVVGGTGGIGGSAGAGGTGGAATGTGGTATVVFTDTAQANGATITNTGGGANAIGGTGGTGGSAATGGTGGDAAAAGMTAVLTFNGSSTAGVGTTITNTGGDATATGGRGGNGGVAGNGGLGGNADATGGTATVTFMANASAGSATIVNTAGTGTVTTGAGGNGDVGAGGDGGTATAIGGEARIIFNNNATAGNATITNNAGATITGNLGAAGTPGAGGGAGGNPGLGSVSSVGASITFNDSATGGSAKLTNNGGVTSFFDTSVFGTAAGALITNNQFGRTEFFETSSLGSGGIVNNAGGSTTFGENSSAGTGTITNNGGSGTFFGGSATAGAATINNLTGAVTAFSDTSNAGTSTLTNAGTIAFNDAADAVAARVINTATGVVNIDVNAFRLGSLSGGGAVNIGANTVQIGYLDLNETFAGVIAGSGGLVKRGTGTFVLSGQNTYTGLTTVNTGTLQVDGRIDSTVTAVVVGATLSGTGRIAGAVGNSGIIRAGNAANPLGTLTVDLGVTFNAGSFLAPTISSAGQASLLQAGSLTINAGTVRPTAAPGGLFLMQTDYRIAVGTGGRSGTFGGVDESQLPTFLDASLFYTPTEVFLRVRRNATNFAQVAGLTPNQSAISGALDAAVVAADPDVFGTYLTTYNTLLGLQANGPLQGALNTLSGDALTVLPVAAQEHASRFARRLDTYTWSNSSNIWGLIAYGDQEADGDGNGPGFDADGLEFQMGFNTSLGANTRLGLSVGYNDADVDSSDRLLTADIETWSLGAQLRHDFGPVYVSGQMTYSWHSVDSSRALLLAGNAVAGFDATTWTAAAELGGVFRSGNLAIEPHVSIRHASTDQDAYSESGPVGVLDVAAADYDTTRLGAGIRLANRDPQAPVRFHALVRYEHETGDRRSVLDNTLPGLPTFTVLGTRLGKDVLTADVGVEFRLSSGVSLFASGGGHTRANETSINANAGLRIAF